MFKTIVQISLVLLIDLTCRPASAAEQPGAAGMSQNISAALQQMRTTGSVAPMREELVSIENGVDRVAQLLWVLFQTHQDAKFRTAFTSMLSREIHVNQGVRQVHLPLLTQLYVASVRDPGPDQPLPRGILSERILQSKIRDIAASVLSLEQESSKFRREYSPLERFKKLLSTAQSNPQTSEPLRSYLNDSLKIVNGSGDKPSGSTASPPTANVIPTPVDASKDGNPNSTVFQVADGASSGFAFDILIGTLGTKLSAEMIDRLDRKMDHSSEFDGLLCKGSKCYTIKNILDFGPTVFMADGYLVAFGYTLRAPAQADSGPIESSYFKDFTLEGEKTIEVMDDNLDPASMMVKTYVHNTKPHLHALTYTRGLNRSLDFYDSSKVEESKLLPGSVKTMGKEMIDQLKKMLKNRKQ